MESALARVVEYLTPARFLPGGVSVPAAFSEEKQEEAEKDGKKEKKNVLAGFVYSSTW